MPGHRTDGRRIALAVEGGGMRGVVGGGMVAAFEQLNMLHCFDAIYGSSAGAVSAAYFVASQARYGVTIFYENINNRTFLDPKRLLFSSKPVLSLEFLLDHVCRYEKPLDVDRILSSSVPLRVLATSVTSLQTVVLEGFADRKELFEALRCSARIPGIAGPPVVFKGDKYLDAAVTESIPFKRLVAEGFTDAVALMTRPFGVGRSTANIIERHLIAPRLKSYNHELPGLYLNRPKEYIKELGEIYAAVTSGEPLRVLPVQKLACEPTVPSTSIRRSELVAGAKAGYAAVYRALGLSVPQLVEIITPFEVPEH